MMIFFVLNLFVLFSVSYGAFETSRFFTGSSSSACTGSPFQQYANELSAGISCTAVPCTNQGGVLWSTVSCPSELSAPLSPIIATDYIAVSGNISCSSTCASSPTGVAKLKFQLSGISYPNGCFQSGPTESVTYNRCNAPNSTYPQGWSSGNIYKTSTTCTGTFELQAFAIVPCKESPDGSNVLITTPCFSCSGAYSTFSVALVALMLILILVL